MGMVWEKFEVFEILYLYLFENIFREFKNFSIKFDFSVKPERLATFYNMKMITYVLYFMINYKNQFPILCFT